MTRDDIIRWAREVGGVFVPSYGSKPERMLLSFDDIERLAAIIANHARHTPGSVRIAENALAQESARGYRKGVAAEREAWHQALRPVFRERMGAEQVREIVQSAIRARCEL